MSVPPLAGLEGQGSGALGGSGAAVRLLSALPRLPSTFQCSAPYTFLQPHFHLGCCSGGVHHGPHCHGCSGACSSPFSRVFYSRLFTMWLSSGSWRPVMTLSHLLCFCTVGGGGGSFLWIFGVQELEPSPSGPFLTVVCPSIGRPGGTGVRSLGWQWCCGSAIVCPSSAPLHFSMLRSLYFLTAPLPSRVLLWRSSPWPSLPWVQWSLLLSLLQGFLQPSLHDVVVLGVLASSHDPLSSPLFL